MKPRTKLQVRVTELSSSLPNIEKKMLDWAKVDCLEHKGYATKSRVICMDCGERFSPELVNRKRAVCPHCGIKLKVEQSRCRTDKQHVYIAIAETCNEFQIIRNFELIAYYRADEVPRYYFHEVLQHWVIPNGKQTVIARNHTINWCCDSWNGDMEIRNEYRRHYYSSGVRYDIYPSKYHPDSTFMPEYRLYGIDSKLQGVTFLEAIKIFPVNPKAETLLKAKQFQLLAHCCDNPTHIERYWTSIKICIRNKYIIKDTKLWIDYLDLLRHFNKDLHNAHYVCPISIKKEHDKLVIKKRRVQEREEAERKRRKAMEHEKKFQKLKSKFFGLQFSDGLIKIKMLESVQEFMEEGDIMHHCVFTNEYYLKPNSLILSAMIKGKHIETIEVDLKKLDIVQSRGVCNTNSKFHDRIIGLVKKNMNLIRQKLTA
ncbi:PcfJ domain-containing protein [Bacteroides intestinalis]|uniref:PcfJ domain-containing protein n=1 Tax=Bacteroides intestinalis TaxID=329854 RepID=UPI00189D50E5|nr:PcfJ domain-containing protein [Bacteroides intestinalis]